MTPRALRPSTVETKSRARNPRPAFPAGVSDTQFDFPFDCEPDDLPVVDVRADIEDDRAMRAAERAFGGRAEDSPAPEGPAEQAVESSSPAEAPSPESPSSPIEEPSRPRRVLPSVIQPETEPQRRLREAEEKTARRGRRGPLSEEEKAQRAAARKANAEKKRAAESLPLLTIVEKPWLVDHQIDARLEPEPEPVESEPAQSEPESMLPEMISEQAVEQPETTRNPVVSEVLPLIAIPSRSRGNLSRSARWAAAAMGRPVVLPGQRWKRRLPKHCR
jgi:hypothetical protein